MLYKNETLYTLTQKDTAEVYKMFPDIKKRAVRLIYPKERIKPPRSRHNKQPEKPNSIAIPMKANVKSPTGGEVWRWALNTIVTGNGQTKYTPSNLIFNGTQAMTENDMDLIWFLLTKSPHVRNGKNWNGVSMKIEFEDRIGNARIKVAAEEQRSQLTVLLYNPELRLSSNKLKEVAMAYFIPDVEELTDDEVRLLLEQAIMRDKKNGPARFLDLIHAEDELKARSVLQKAIDAKLIKQHVSLREWWWVNEAGKKVATIMKVSTVMNAYDALSTLYLKDENFRQEVDSALKVGEFEPQTNET